jgi:hypothetical protein
LKAKIDQRKLEKEEILCFESAGCSILRAEGFSEA